MPVSRSGCRARGVVCVVGVLLVSMGVPHVGARGAPTSTTTPTAVVASTYTADINAPGGAVFDGVGAISGGGGETILLPSYPAAQRQQILDYLLRPSYGASLHILKIEVGGDALSTDGAEPSHMPTESDPPNFQRGYEWWVATEAKKRNPHIALYGLPWEWPAWVGDGTGSPYRNVSKPVRYITEWLRGARAVHNLSFDYIGIWNERAWDAGYILALRKALDAAGFARTKIVAPDAAKAEANELITAMMARSDLRAAVHAVGYHYPDSDPNVTLADRAALELPLWSSEDDSTVDPPVGAPDTPRPRRQPGGGCLARTINQNWVQGGLTATIVWNLVMARYPQMRWDYTGLVAATDPFGGHYDVLPPVWAAAHTTQFTQPGWRVLPTGGGSGWLAHGGTYVTYTSPNKTGITIVVEKMDANESICQRGVRPKGQILETAADNATFVLRGYGTDTAATAANGVPLPPRLAVWASHFGGSEPAAGLFVQRPDVPVVNGRVTIEVRPNWVYTLSTVRTATKAGGGHQRPAPPRLGAFPTVYEDSFDDCAVSSIPKYLAPLAGAFECVPAPAPAAAADEGRTARAAGRVVRQTSPAKAICDRGDVAPYAIIGDGFRTDYNVSVDVRLPPAGGKEGAGSDDGHDDNNEEHHGGDGGPARTADTSAGAFIGARTKGPVGSNVGMDGVFLAVNATTWWIALDIVTVVRGGHGVLAAGALARAPQGASCWRRLSLSVSGTTARASIDGVVVSHATTIPAPHDHYTGEVAGLKVNLGAGGYASMGTVGYTGVIFDNLNVESANHDNGEHEM